VGESGNSLGSAGAVFRAADTSGASLLTMPNQVTGSVLTQCEHAAARVARDRLVTGR
jgi:hypothetical protein